MSFTILIDAVIGFTLLEMLGLWAWHRFTGKGLAPAAWVPNLLAGLGLMLALRAIVAEAGWIWVVAGLMGSGLAHAVDLRRRWAASQR